MTPEEMSAIVGYIILAAAVSAIMYWLWKTRDE